jgi:hypothetical protein
MVEAYFDESGTDEGSPVLCVAGYIIEKNEAVAMDSEWGSVLEQFNLPYFRMSSCAHGARPFGNIDKEARIEVEKAMIAIIKRRVSYGIAVTVEPRIFEAIMPRSPEIGSAYTFCAHTCLTGVVSWAEETKYSGGIAYFFESGHRSQSEANEIMNRLFNIPIQRARHRYVSHTFADKKLMRPLQAADILAWQWFTDHKRRMGGAVGPRKDCYELTSSYRNNGRALHHVLHWDPILLRTVAAIPLRNEYPLTFPG